MVISHIDRTIFDTDRLLRLADTGVVLEFDLFGTEQSYYPLSDIDMPNDATRLRLIRARTVLGDTDKAKAAYKKALETFSGKSGRGTLNILDCSIKCRLVLRGKPAI